MTKFSVDQHPVNDGVLRSAITGEVDLANSDVLADAISTTIKTWSVAQVVVDQLTVRDSTGICVLMTGYTLATDYGVGHFVVNPTTWSGGPSPSPESSPPSPQGPETTAF